MLDYELMAQILYESTKPSNQSEWGKRFDFWSKSASDTEEAKLDAAKRQIGAALAASNWLKAHPYEIIPQGSYHNNTNVRNDSDVDLCVCLTETVFYEAAYGESAYEIGQSYTPLNFTFADYKAQVAQALSDYFGRSAVKVGTKAIALHSDNDKKVNADVLPAYTHRLYAPRNQWINNYPRVQETGIGFLTSYGKKIYNFPTQHYVNGVNKNTDTLRRFKRVVRVLKRLRNHMLQNNVSSINAPSFLIESLVYNCPNTDFASDSLYENLKEVLLTLRIAFKPENNYWVNYAEVNGIKRLFHADQPWTVEQAKQFVHAAYTYVFG